MQRFDHRAPFGTDFDNRIAPYRAERSSVPADELDLRALGLALWSRRLLIAGATLAVAMLTFVGLMFVTPTYKAETRVLYEAKESVFLRPDADRTQDRAVVDAEAVTSQVQLIQSRDLALGVIRDLKLGELPEFDPMRRSGSPLQVLLSLVGLGSDPIAMSPEDRVLRAFSERLTVYTVDRSRVIAIEFESRNAELAARVANAVAEGYLKLQQEAKLGQNRAATQFLASEIASLRPKVEAAEAKVEQQRANTNLLFGTNNTTLSNQQLGDYNAQVAQVRAQRADAEGKARLVRETLRSGGPLEFNDIVNSDVLRQLTQQRVSLAAQLAEQSSTLLPLHPRIKELNAQLGTLERQMRTEAERLARALENEARVAGARMESLLTGLDQLKKQASATNEQDVGLRALERDAKSQRDLLESYLAKYREAAARDNLDASSADARIISRAVPASIPAWPKKIPTTVIAALGTMLLLIAIILTGQLLSGPTVAAASYRDGPQERPATTGWRRWFSRREREASARPVAVPPRMSYQEAVERLAADIRKEGSGRVTVVGAAGGIVTGNTALALARNLSQQSRVVLVDLAPRETEAALAFGRAGQPRGLADLARGRASFSDIIRRDTTSQAHVIVAGGRAGEIAATIDSHRVKMAMEALARSYDHVIVDAGFATDAPLGRLSGFAPRAVLVSQDLDGEATRAVREHLLQAGFTTVTVITGQSAAPEPAVRRARRAA